MIEVEAPDGSIVEFPEGTPPDVIEAAMRQAFGGVQTEATAPASDISVTLRPDITDAAERESMGLPPIPVMQQLDYIPGVTEVPGDTSMAGLGGAAARGLTAPMAGAAIGAALGAPFAGVGAVPGAAAGLAAGALTEAVGDPIVAGVNRMFGTNFTEPTTALQNLLTSLGVPEADSEAERIVQKMTTGVAGAAGGIGMGRAIASAAGASRPVLSRVGAAMAEQPGVQIAGGAGAGLAAGMVPEDAGPLAEAGAGLAGGIAGGLAGAGIASRRAIADAAQEAVGMAGGGRASVGAAATPEELLRRQRAEEFGVNILPPQASREFIDQQKMREFAKLPEGEDIRTALDDQQEQLTRAFERFVERTGSEAWNSPREQGVRITAGLQKMLDQARAKVNVLYERAKASGETREPVAYDELRAFIAQQTPTNRKMLAPVLNSVDEQLTMNDPANTGQITLEQIEDVRKMINKVAEPGTPNNAYGKEMKAIIDGITENAGGDVYKAARAARVEQAKNFENIGLVAQLLGTKRRSEDRQVAYERVVEKFISRETPVASIEHVKKLLNSEGGDPQAWREVQGAVMETIKDAAYKGISRNQRGETIVSPTQLNNVLTELDKSGKLDALFDKQTAQMLRDVRLLVLDLETAPPGSFNTSGTTSTLINALDWMARVPGVTGLMATGVNKAREAAVKQALKKEVRRLVGDKTQ